MPLPIVQSLFQQIFGSSLPTASLARPTESSDEEGEDVVRRGPAISFQDVLTRQFLGPTILPKTIDTPSGKVFAPDDPIPAKPNILATYPEKEEKTKIISSPMPTGEPKGLMGLPIPETQDKLKGFETPQDVDMKILYKVENDEPKFKYPTKEEVKKYINEENEFWIKNQERANERYPELSSKNLPKITEADKHFGAAAFSFQDFKNSKLIYMSPKEYLNLTQKFRPKEGEEKLGSTMNVQNIENLLKEGKELANIPVLYVKKTGDSFVVDGQEGIHRAKAFNNLGYDKIPVVVEGSTRAHAKEIKDFFPTSIQAESGEVLLTKPEDFYSVINKKKLFNPESTTVNVPIDKPSLKTQDYLDEKIVDELLKLRGGKQKFEESMKESMAPMPASTKNKMEIILQEKLFNKYKLNEYPEGESPDTVSEERKQKLINTYNKNLEAISYITSAAYDAIPGPNKNTVFVVDNDGLPIAGAKIGKGDLLGNAAKEAIAIKEVGSINSNATNDLLKEINAKALANGKKYIVAEDITSQEAIDAFKAKGFEPASLKKYKQFEGKLIYRPNSGKKVKQKNYVKEVEGYEEITSNPVGSLVDKPLPDE